jgi:restriction system protein
MIGRRRFPALPASANRRNALAQIALAVLTEIFRAEHGRMVNMVTINGFVSGADPATGRRNKVFLLAVNVGRHAFTRLELARIDSVSCLEGPRGQLSPRPESLVPVHPTWLAGAVEAYDDSTSTSSSLLEMARSILKIWWQRYSRLWAWR